MDDKLLNDVAKVLAVHQHETVTANQRTEELKYLLPDIDDSFIKQSQNQQDLQDILAKLELSQANDSQLKQIQRLLDDVDNILTEQPAISTEPTFDDLDSLNPTNNWSELLKQTAEYGSRHQLDLKNPYFQMMSKYEFNQQTNELINKLQTSRLEKSDYIFSACAGVIAGLIDVFLVGKIHSGSNAVGLQKSVDHQFDVIITAIGKHTRILELKRQKEALQSSIKGTPTLKELERLKKFNERINNVKNFSKQSAIRTLENHFKVSYDAAHNGSIISGYVSGMNANNHHLRSLPHDPSILGLIVGIIDQLTNKDTFIDDHGKIIRVVTKNIENAAVTKGPLPLQIIKSIQNWFGHLLSDVAGASGSKGRGAGLPIPFFSVTQALNFGSIPIKGKDLTVAQSSEWLYKQGFDLRAFTAQAIPVLIQESLIRMYWFIKQHFYLGNSIKDSLPSGKDPDLNKMLLTSTAVFGNIDFLDATIRSGGFADISELLLHLN